MASKPTIQDRVRERICPNCGATPERKSAKGPRPTFCSKECKRSHNNRLLVEGRAMAPFVKAWRIDRGQGEIAQKSLAQMCEIADLFNAQDLELGRPRADIYAATILVEGTRYFDRQRPAKRKVSAS
jgi:endogenous inhibitor of DNA gyrase (YacG/DUF329 family)